MGPEDAVEPLHGDSEDGGTGASEGDLCQGQQPGYQQGVNLPGNKNTFYEKNTSMNKSSLIISTFFNLNSLT